MTRGVTDQPGNPGEAHRGGIYQVGTRLNGIDRSTIDRLSHAARIDPVQAGIRFRVATRWTGQTRSESMVEGYDLGGKHVTRRFKIIADEPADLMGGDSAPNPQELLMSAMNACMTVGYVAQATVRGISLSVLEIETDGMLDMRGFLGIDDRISPGYQQLDFTVRIGGNASADSFREIHEAVMQSSPNFSILSQPICMNGRLEITTTE